MVRAAQYQLQQLTANLSICSKKAKIASPIVYSSIADPCYFCVDPDADLDPSIFVTDLQDANKTIVFLVFLLITF